MAVGAAFAGLRPILEFMTFVSLLLDPIHAWMPGLTDRSSNCLQNFASKQPLLDPPGSTSRNLS